jgi:cytochrome c556
MVHRSIAWIAAVALTASAVGLASVAVGADAKTTIETRQANMKKMGADMKALNDELKKDSPDLGVVRTSATDAEALANKLDSWFPKGTGTETGVKTAAKPEVWSDTAGFATSAHKLDVEAIRLQQIAAAGDIQGLKAQPKEISAACKACHDKFRAPATPAP